MNDRVAGGTSLAKRLNPFLIRESFEQTSSGQVYTPLRLNPFLIRESFELSAVLLLAACSSLNPFLIRESFEPITITTTDLYGCLNPFLIRESFELQSKILAFKINGLKPLILAQNQGKKADEVLIKLLNNFLANSSLAILQFYQIFLIKYRHFYKNG